MQEVGEDVANLISGGRGMESLHDWIAKQWWEVYREALGQPYDWDTLPPQHREAVAVACKTIMGSMQARGREPGEWTKAVDRGTQRSAL